MDHRRPRRGARGEGDTFGNKSYQKAFLLALQGAAEFFLSCHIVPVVPHCTTIVPHCTTIVPHCTTTSSLRKPNSTLTPPLWRVIYPALLAPDDGQKSPTTGNDFLPPRRGQATKITRQVSNSDRSCMTMAGSLKRLCFGGSEKVRKSLEKGRERLGGVETSRPFSDLCLRFF